MLTNGYRSWKKGLHVRAPFAQNNCLLTFSKKEKKKEQNRGRGCFRVASVFAISGLTKKNIYIYTSKMGGTENETENTKKKRGRVLAGKAKVYNTTQ